jgi:signal transduction histidine kinase
MTTTPRWHRTLLPGEFLDGAAGRRSARDRLVDVVLWLIAIGVGIATLAESWSAHPAWSRPVDIVVGLAALVVLAWRRSHPDTVGIALGVASIFSALAGGAGLVALFNVALRGSWRGMAAVAALALAAALVFPALYTPDDGYVLNILVGGLITALVLGWGLLARARREQLLDLRDRALRVEAEQRLRVEQAREAERRRIAGEMHDVLAHRVSLLSLHAGALEFRPDAPPHEIAHAAGVIRAAAHAALEELREVIGVLRDGTDPDAPPAPPQPTLRDIPALVEESRAAGMRVTCAIDLGGRGEAPAVLGRTAYRIVQEGLTNARKHAPDAPVKVCVTGGEDLEVEVISRGPVGVARAADPLPGAGSGLVGLDERVALAGGTLWHGADPAGDFVLRARLPWTA